MIALHIRFEKYRNTLVVFSECEFKKIHYSYERSIVVVIIIIIVSVQRGIGGTGARERCRPAPGTYYKLAILTKLNNNLYTLGCNKTEVFVKSCRER